MLPFRHYAYYARRGFTLIELSIVLVIIGLLVGGVLVGKALIEAAFMHAQISQIESYNTAANTFKTKYNALPGDIDAAKASQFGLAVRIGGAGHGDNNGLLEGGAAEDMRNAGENALFWNDLSTANLLGTSYVGIDCYYTGAPIPYCIGGGGGLRK